MTYEQRDDTNGMGYAVKSRSLIFWIAVCCLGIELILVSLDLLFTFTTWIPVIELRKIFDMTRETSVGTWLSVTLSFLAGLTLLLVFFVARAEDGSKRETMGWLILSLFFICMSVDDCACIHERSGDFLERMVSAGAIPPGLSRVITWFPTFYWQLIMGPFFAAIGLFMLYFLWQRFGSVNLRKYIIVSLTGLAVAMLIDFFEGMGRGVKRLEMATGMSEESVYHMIRLIEESLEIFSMIVLCCAFLRYLCVILENRAIIIAK